MTTKIAIVQPSITQDWEQGEIARISTLLSTAPAACGFEITQDSDTADVVVLLESCTFKNWHSISSYCELLNRYGAARLVCINYEDVPPGFLPGLYSSLEAHRFDHSLHLSWPYLRLPNTHVYDVPAEADRKPEWLFTFSGACSHPLRQALLQAYGSLTTRYKVREVRRWYDHSAALKSRPVGFCPAEPSLDVR